MRVRRLGTIRGNGGNHGSLGLALRTTVATIFLRVTVKRKRRKSRKRKRKRLH